ncbi:MAG: AhpC/TSA family protein [Planctomycetaceae bacterium]
MEELSQRSVQIRLVTFEEPSRATSYVAKADLPWPLMLDENRSLYRVYGLESATWWSLYSPVSILKYLWLMARGFFPGKPGSDWNQLGGNVLVDPKGIVQLIHASKTPHDRPSVTEILSIVTASEVMPSDVPS